MSGNQTSGKGRGVRGVLTVVCIVKRATGGIAVCQVIRLQVREEECEVC